MSSVPLSFFDRLAPGYDETWTNSAIGRAQRNAVWREVDGRVSDGSRVLDLGCGTGEDASHFVKRGATIDAIDGSRAMVEAARARGIDARLLPIEQIGTLSQLYDLVFSDFGAFNCVEDLARLREPLARLVRPQGALAICVMNRFCLWETVYYALRMQFRKASRRWSGVTQTSEGLRVFYPSARAITAALQPDFHLICDTGIGVTVPPSYVRGFGVATIDRLHKFDSCVAASLICRSIADHRLLIFTRGR